MIIAQNWAAGSGDTPQVWQQGRDQRLDREHARRGPVDRAAAGHRWIPRIAAVPVAAVMCVTPAGSHSARPGAEDPAGVGDADPQDLARQPHDSRPPQPAPGVADLAMNVLHRRICRSDPLVRPDARDDAAALGHPRRRRDR
ncbi:hypothetical protein XF36_09125 [Pseudonocardia sp. HH130629-09]|nr:hypothetical protein XF36_09125 [Pseudonocardia sp. HH130629-09]